jgi:hypothetical protein
MIERLPGQFEIMRLDHAVGRCEPAGAAVTPMTTITASVMTDALQDLQHHATEYPRRQPMAGTALGMRVVW